MKILYFPQLKIKILTFLCKKRDNPFSSLMKNSLCNKNNESPFSSLY